VAASAVVHLGYFNCLIAGYRASDLTVVYPVARGSGPFLSALAAVLLLGEHLGLYGALGLAGVVGGILLVTMGPRLIGRGVADREATAQIRRRHGVYWGMATGTLIAGYTVLDGYAAVAAAAILHAVNPDTIGHCLLAGLSGDDGQAKAAARLGLKPLLDLHIGDNGVAAVLAAGLLKAASTGYASVAVSGVDRGNRV